MKQTKQDPRTMSQDTNKRIVEPYLSFEARCEEALEFYRKSIGPEVTVLLRYKDPRIRECPPLAHPTR
jgi:hypothetical protein